MLALICLHLNVRARTGVLALLPDTFDPAVRDCLRKGSDLTSGDLTQAESRALSLFVKAAPRTRKPRLIPLRSPMAVVTSIPAKGHWRAAKLRAFSPKRMSVWNELANCLWSVTRRTGKAPCCPQSCSACCCWRPIPAMPRDCSSSCRRDFRANHSISSPRAPHGPRAVIWTQRRGK